MLLVKNYQPASNLAASIFMLNEKKSISFWLVSIALLTFLFLIQSFYPKYIDQLYSQKKIAVLNHLTLSHDEHSLEYYRGKINDLLIGPVYSFITGVIFFLFAFVYLRGAKGWHIGIAVFVYLFLTRRNILTFPPYGDALVGPFSDAIWLLRHQFNYPAYWQVDSFLTGGPQVYPTSIYPGFLAVLMKVAPSAKVFLIIMHLLSFAMAAGVIALFRAVLQRIMDQDLALIGSFLLLSHPLFQSMSELINMEMPSVLFALLAIFALINQRMYWACCMAFISLMIKGPGAIACLCVFLGSVILYFAQSKGERKWLPMVVSGILCVFVLIKMKVRNAIIGGNVSHNNISFLSGWYLVKDKLYFWIFLLIALGLCLRLGYVYWKREKGLRQIFMDYFTPGMMVLTAGLWFLVHANFSALIYRYELLLLPFLLFTFIYIFYLVFNNSGFLKGFMFCVMCLFFLSSHGLFYQGQRVIGYLYPQIERSLEYRNDLKMHMALADEVQQKSETSMIGAPLFMALALNFPEFGYVKAPVPVMLYEMVTQHEGIKNFQGLDNAMLHNTVWIGFKRDSLQHLSVEYPVDPRDKILMTIERGDKEGILFMGGFAIERMRIIFELQKTRLREMEKLDAPP